MTEIYLNILGATLILLVITVGIGMAVFLALMVLGGFKEKR